MKYIRITLYVLLIILLFAVLLSGCSILQSKPDITIPPGSRLLAKTIVQNNWLLTFSIIGVGAGFFAFLNGNSRGLSIMASCFVVLSLILAITRFGALIAATTMVGAMALLAFTIITRKRALKDTIRTVEYAKEKIKRADNNLIWNSNFIEDMIQHPVTTKLVKNIKRKLK